MNLNINLPKEELIAAAKVSVGKDRTYWMDLSHKGATEIFDLNKELLPFVHDPESYSKEKYDAGKDRTYWMDLSHKGATEIFDLNKELLPFVHDPESYSKEKYDAQLRETFYRKVNELLGQDYLNKPASTLAGEVVKAMLDGLANGNCDKILESVYKGWLDSVTYRDSFSGYLGNYTLGSDLDIWNVSIHHPSAVR